MAWQQQPRATTRRPAGRRPWRRRGARARADRDLGLAVPGLARRAVPGGVAQRQRLEHYASSYRTVENNASFYRLPAEQTFAGWRARTPGGFVMAVKASRYLTHVRKLRDPEEPVARLLGAAALGPTLGPVLLQLPPALKAEPALLDACLTAFQRTPSSGHGPLRITVEPRHSSWWTAKVRQILAAHDAALCWADRRGRAVIPLWRTAGWGTCGSMRVRPTRGPATPSGTCGDGPGGYGRRGRLSRRVRLLQQRPGRRRRGQLGNLRGAGRDAGLTVTRTPRSAGYR